MKNLGFTLLLLIYSSPVLGQYMGSDEFGFAFNAEYWPSCIETFNIPSDNLLPMNLILVNPTLDDISGMEFGYSIEGPAEVVNLEWWTPNFLDLGSPGNHIVRFGSPLILQDVNVLATFTILYTGDGQEPVGFRLFGSTPSIFGPEYPGLLDEDGQVLSPIVWGTCYGDGYSGIIWPAYCCISPTEVRTWGSMKSLYK
jgi:hypothetical protein